jgi:hypothetical protein
MIDGEDLQLGALLEENGHWMRLRVARVRPLGSLTRCTSGVPRHLPFRLVEPAVVSTNVPRVSLQHCA